VVVLKDFFSTIGAVSVYTRNMDAQTGPPVLLAVEFADAGAEVEEEEEFFSRNFLLMLTALNLLGCGGAGAAAAACEPNGTSEERTGATGLGSTKGRGGRGSGSTTERRGEGGAGAGTCSVVVSAGAGASSATLPGVSSGKLLVWVSSLAIDQSCGCFPWVGSKTYSLRAQRGWWW
jgi:hypothetical protein